MCITTNRPDTKSNPNPNPTIKQHTIVNIQLNTVTCLTYPDKFIRDSVVAPFVLLKVVIVTFANNYNTFVYKIRVCWSESEVIKTASVCHCCRVDVDLLRLICIFCVNRVSYRRCWGKWCSRESRWNYFLAWDTELIYCEVWVGQLQFCPNCLSSSVALLCSVAVQKCCQWNVCRKSGIR